MPMTPTPITCFISRDVRVRNHEVTHQHIEFTTRGDKLTESASAGREGIELFDRDAPLGVSTPEIGKFLRQFLNDSPVYRIVDARTDLDVTGVEADLPRVRW